MTGAVDLDGNARILQGRDSGTVDIGVYEYVYKGPAAATWYVDGSVTQSGDGTTPQTAYKTIQEAIDGSSDARDTVVVAAGTYLENVDFRGKNIVLRSVDPSDGSVVGTTILDGNQAGSADAFAGGGAWRSA